jgi:hypothetical protein
MIRILPSLHASSPGTPLVLVAIAAAAIAATTIATACDPSPERQAPEPANAAATPGSAGASEDTAAVAAGIESSDETTPDSAAWRPLAVPSPADPDTYPLTILNPHRIPLAVFADGGAGEVLLDTVMAGESARVKLLIAADSVTLRAVGPDGTPGPADRVGLERGLETTWEARY